MLGMAFSLSRVDVLYTSPLLRARQTAQMIAQMHGLQKLEPVVEPGLSELDGDCWRDVDLRSWQWSTPR